MVDRFKSKEEYTRWLSGHLFSNLAWLDLSSNAPDGATILRESAVFDLMKDSRDLKVEQDELGREMVAGVYVPDGALVARSGSSNRIFTFYEYTSSLDFRKLVRQFIGFRHVRREINGTDVDNANFVFVIQGTPEEVLHEIKEELIETVGMSEADAASLEFVSLPISSLDFSRFRNAILAGERLKRAVLEREAVLSIDIPLCDRKRELGERARRLFQKNGGNTEEDEAYVGNYAPRHAHPLNRVKNVDVLTLPRFSPPSPGKPSLLMVGKPE
jgi:hypothetical protein